jgi:hypothetical protein
MAERNLRLCPDLTPLQQLHRQVEIGWKDLDAGRVLDSDANDIKQRGRERRAQKTEDQGLIPYNRREDS